MTDRQPKRVNVAEAKRNFSDLMSRAALRGERFIIERNGKPMVALVGIEDMEKLPAYDVSGRKGLLAAIGAWEGFPNIDKLVEEIYKSRNKARDRRVRNLR